MKLLLLAFGLFPFCLNAQIITTIAGTGTAGYAGDGGAATAAQIRVPTGIAYRLGIIYFSDAPNNVIRKIDAYGNISTIAGSGTVGYSGDGSAATLAKMYSPEGLAVDTAGNLFVVDELNQVIRKISTTGIITTIAGNHTMGYSGDGGAATAASLNSPADIVLDNAGSFYFSDGSNNRIRKVSAMGIITTVAGTGTAGYSGDGGMATSALIQTPTGITLDTAGNLFFADHGNDVVRKVSTSGVISTIAGNNIGGYSGDGGQATAAKLYGPRGLIFDAAGNLYIADQLNSVIRMVNTSGIISTAAGNNISGYSGDGGPATAAEMTVPVDFALDACGNLLFSDGSNFRVRKISFNPGCDLLTLDIGKVANENNATSIYPNPVATTLFIKANEKIANVTIVNTLGQKVYTHSPNSEEVEIRVNDLPAGVYFVRINETEVRKFVKE